MGGLDDLPPELYAVIIEHLDPSDAQQSILSLTRAAPYATIPLEALFRRICIRRPEQVINLYRRLRKTPQDAAMVRTFTMESWTVDADMVVNVLSLLHDVQELTLLVGPNFAPEHLEDLVHKPRSRLKYLSLRFRP